MPELSETDRLGLTLTPKDWASLPYAEPPLKLRQIDIILPLVASEIQEEVKETYENYS